MLRWNEKVDHSGKFCDKTSTQQRFVDIPSHFVSILACESRLWFVIDLSEKFR